MRAEFEKIDKQVTAVLTKTQQKKYEEMKQARQNIHYKSSAILHDTASSTFYIFSGAETPIRSRAFFIVIIAALTSPSLWFVSSGLDGSLTLQEL